MFWKRGIRFFKRIGVELTLWYSLTILIVTASACIILYHRLHMKLYKQVNYTLKGDAEELSLFLLRPGMTLDDFSVELQRAATTKRYFQMSGRLLSSKLETVVASDNFLFLFRVPLAFQRDMEEGVISKYLREGFEARGITLGDDIAITKEGDGRWTIRDKDQQYSVIRKGEDLDIYYASYAISEEALTNARKGKRTLETTRIERHKYQYRVRTLPIMVNGELRYIFQLAIYLKYVDKNLENYLENVSALLPGGLLISAIVGWLIARRCLSPIVKMSRAAQRITARRLGERLEVRDIGDELDELAETLNTMLDRLEGAFNQMSRFTADVSHELRTPITTLRTATEVTLSGDQTVGAYRNHCENSLAHLVRVTRMINDLLLLSRSDAGTERPEMAALDVAEMLDELRDPFNAVAASRHVTLSFNCTEGSMINGNATLLRRLFSNLIDNALKCTPSGGRIDLELEDEANSVIIRVKDTGIGISEGDYPRIFDRFYRVDESRSRNTGGTGLGLSICQCIVKLHGGDIEVETKLGVGTTFKVMLPKDQ